MKLFRNSLLFFAFLLPALSMAATPKEEAQQLVDAVLPFAEQALSKHGEFYPFGAELTSSGKIEAAMGYNGQEHPSSAEIIAMLHTGLGARAKAGQVRATALVYDARVQLLGTSSKSDAVAIELEHRAGYNVTVYFPYTVKGSIVSFATPFAAAGPHQVFGGSS
jgi:hypothetical protein